jgi:hypothetical protein
MAPETPISFKIATEAAEMDQIFRLNYRTFVQEIPQHKPNPERRLVDRFHHENTYFIATRQDQLIGMMAVRDRRPFSLDEKLGNLDDYLPAGVKVCEIRLLSVVPSYRNGRVFQGLLTMLLEYGRRHQLDLAVISGSVRQSRLYQHLGFTPFGPPVGPSAAKYQPMYLALLWNMLEGVDLQRMRPLGLVAKVHPGDWTVRILGDAGGEYLLYLAPAWRDDSTSEAPPSRQWIRPDGRITLALGLPAGHYSIQWACPSTHESIFEEQRNHQGGLMTFNVPAFHQHIGAHLRRCQ